MLLIMNSKMNTVHIVITYLSLISKTKYEYCKILIKMNFNKPKKWKIFYQTSILNKRYREYYK